MFQAFVIAVCLLAGTRAFALDTGFIVPLLLGNVSVIGPRDLTFSIVQPPRIRVERENSTLDAAIWVAQTVGGRLDIVYLGGIAFSRITERREYQFARAGSRISIPSTRSITYGVGPVVGLDTRFRVTRHLLLVPGVRFLSVPDNNARAWLSRSSVGLGWRF